MSTESDPAVKELTAKIHVLQVGSKPVALSAARQLDSVDPAEIDPFGRARIDPKPAEGVIEVIGPAKADGVLVRSSAQARKVECPGYATSRDSYRGYGPPQRTCHQHRSTSPAGAAGASHRWTEYTPSKEIYDSWQALPLIVLAGLR
jgi:hypothetical protein